MEGSQDFLKEVHARHLHGSASGEEASLVPLALALLDGPFPRSEAEQIDQSVSDSPLTHLPKDSLFLQHLLQRGLT